MLAGEGQAHYMRGGLPGAYPSFKKYLNGVFPHPVPLDLYDPFGIFSNASPEKKARGRNAEVNNGRLAMIGLFSLVAETKVPGSVPFLDQFVRRGVSNSTAPRHGVTSRAPRHRRDAPHSIRAGLPGLRRQRHGPLRGPVLAPRLEGAPARTGTRTRLPLCRPRATFPEVTMIS